LRARPVCAADGSQGDEDPQNDPKADTTQLQPTKKIPAVALDRLLKNALRVGMIPFILSICSGASAAALSQRELLYRLHTLVSRK
jgi:hypothetical protein